MMTGVSALMAMRGARFWIRAGSSVLALGIVAAGGIVVWYRLVYNVWPGHGASARVHWCGRNYEYFGAPPQTWQQVSSHERLPIRAVGQYPPLGGHGRSCSLPPPPRHSGSPSARRCPAR